VQSRANDADSGLHKRIRGAVFLGCPFGGSDCASIVDKWTSLAGNKQGLLQSLKLHSPRLATLQKDFLEGFSRLKIVCFYEKLKTAKTVIVSS
jgi:hypothetical protein